VYLFGAGHVSLQVARLAKIVDFHTVVLDDRHEFANRERFAGADDIQVLSSFEEACGDLDIDADSCLVILTRGHLHDKTVLRQALGTQAGYIGMIGSRRKRDLIYTALRAEGFSAGDLNKVHCPIGLAIGAQTPEEIAVSIVAELIRFRANRQPDE
jgi:xanthine dehydrogenase accessory factor